MSVDCGACFAKYLLCLFNFFFFIAGAVVLGIGIWLAADKGSFIQVTNLIDSQELEEFTQPTVIEQAAYILIIAGAFVFFVSFLGYCGAIRESRCLLTCYGVALLIILVLEVTAGGLAAGYKDKAEIESRKFLKSTIRKYYATPDKTDAVTLFWNHMMLQMKCCGVDDYQDFKESELWSSGSLTVPPACCLVYGDTTNTQRLQLKDPSCPYTPTLANSYYKTGCYKQFMQLLEEHANVAIGIGIGLGLVQLLGIFLAFCLCKSIDRYYK